MMDLCPQHYGGENLSGETFFLSTTYLAAEQWFEAHFVPWTIDDLKPFSQQMCSILYQHNLQSHPQIPIEIHSNAESF